MLILRLAWGNIRRARRDYLVYLLTLALGVAVFYAFNAIALTLQFDPVTHRQAPDPIRLVTQGLTIFLAIVMGFLMVYANGYIMRRRAREFGLYQVLGMSRHRLVAIIAVETLILCSWALVLGDLIGVALSQLLVFLTAAMFEVSVSDYHFVLSVGALALTVWCLTGIFIVTLLYNIRGVRHSAPADLMVTGRRSERAGVGSGWMAVALFILGAGLCVLAWARLLHDGYPFTNVGRSAAQLSSAGQAPTNPWSTFLVTTLIAAAGTILLFFGLSSALLGAVRRTRHLYWRGLTAFTARQIAARVNTVSLSMAVISMILFLTITCVVTGTSFADATKTALRWATPADYSCTVNYVTPRAMDDRAGTLSGKESRPDAAPQVPLDLIGIPLPRGAGAASLDLGSIARSHVQVDVYLPRAAGTSAPLVTMEDLIGDGGRGPGAETGRRRAGVQEIEVVKASAYNRYLVFLGKAPIEFGARGYTLTAGFGSDLAAAVDKALSSGRVIQAGGVRLHPAAKRVIPEASAFENSAGSWADPVIVLPDAIVDAAGLPLMNSSLLIDYRDGRDAGELDAELDHIDLNDQPALFRGTTVARWQGAATRSSMLDRTRGVFGGISFISVYIGFVLVIACASILSIQQLTGVSESIRSYRTLSELGTERSAIVRSMAQQLAMFFLAPLAVGLAHALVALTALRELIGQKIAVPIEGSAGITIAVFVACYGGYLLLTYLLGRDIVREAVRLRRGR